MGRKKIQISKITDERNRQVTFNKRKFGVMKKAYELSVLCDCEIALIIFSSSNKLYQYASTDMDKVLLKYTEYNEPHESLTNKNIIEKEHKHGVMSPDSPEQDTEYTLTPRTEAKFNKIDEEFQTLVRNQQMVSNRVNMSGNYTLPVSVPVGGSYGDSGMLQASPQMAHQNISPRPSSSETDSRDFIVYPSGSILEMSNGYPNSASPLGGSESPGPSPSIGGHHHNNHNHSHKSHHISHKQHSPGGGGGGQAGRISSNLRVVIPSSMTQNMSADDLSYSEHNRQNHASLNTPVVALQTPGIPGLTSYPLGAPFGAQDFSMNSADVGMALSNWNQHNMNAVQHTARFGEISLPHLTVTNSSIKSPPASPSPPSVKVKSEPASPPRDHHQHNSIISGGGQNHTTTITTMGNAITNQSSLLSHPQQHLIMNSRPSSTGHLTPTSGAVTPTNVPSPDMRHSNSVGSQQSSLNDYDSPNLSQKRQRISDSWTT